MRDGKEIWKTVRTSGKILATPLIVAFFDVLLFPPSAKLSVFSSHLLAQIEDKDRE